MDTALLNDLFTDKLLGKFGEKNGRHFARLKETDKSAKLKQIDIFDVPEGSVLINLDKAEDMLKYRAPINPSLRSLIL